LEEADLEQVRLVDFHDGVGLLGDGGGEGVEANGTAAEARRRGREQGGGIVERSASGAVRGRW
jgi:hypothetical protein